MRAVLFLPFLGGFVGYVGAHLFGVTDGLMKFVLAVLCMILAGVGGLVMSRKTRG